MSLPTIGEPLLLVTAQLVATLFMTGLIWFVQIVHYPLMGAVGRDASAAYAARHATRTTWVVAPPMLVEVAAATALVLEVPPGSSFATAAWGFGLVFLLWVVTATLSIPCHSRLQRSFDARAHRLLVLSNWIRTVAWSARVPIAVLMFHAYLTTSHA